jgi:hypothetical protein
MAPFPATLHSSCAEQRTRPAPVPRRGAGVVRRRRAQARGALPAQCPHHAVEAIMGADTHTNARDCVHSALCGILSVA